MATTITQTSSMHLTAYKPTPDPFQQLVKELSDALGPTSGLDSDEIDHNELIKIMEGYTSKTTEWQKYALADYSRAYTRNLVDKGNGKSNLLVVVWTPGKGSPIHDHANAHCVMKILRGKLQETLYDFPDESELRDGKPSPPKVTRNTIYTENQVTYMSDKIGLHKVGNPDPERVAVSLHLYTPPHAANHGCHIFCPKTGKPTHALQCTYSEYGQLV